MTYWLLYLKTFVANPIFAVKLSDPDAQAACGGDGFLGFPQWYEYLDIKLPDVDGEPVCSPSVSGLNDIWLIVLAVIEILLRVTVIIAIAFVIVGGIKFITARGNPDKINTARNSVQDALIGLVIAISATAIVSFIAGRFEG